MKGGLFASPDFLRLWLGQVASNTGFGISRVAMPLLVLALTGSPAQAGLVAAMQGLPYVMFGLVAGALIDRWDRRRILIACDVARALAVGSVPLAWALGALTVAQLYAAAFVQGCAFVFANLCQVAVLPRVVERARIPSAQALSASSMSVAALVGPGLGGVLVGLGKTTVAGAALAYLADALAYVVSAGLLIGLRTPLQGERGPRRQLHREIGEGLRYVWHDRPIRLLAFVNAAHRLVLGPVVVLAVVVFGRDELGADPPTIGLLVGAAGAGGLLGAALTPPLRRRLPVGWHVIGVTAGHGLGLAVVALAPTLPLALAGMVVAGMAEAMTGIVQVAYRLEVIPDALQGRVNAVYRLGSFTATTVGTAAIGLLLEALGARSVMGLMAGLAGLVALGSTVSGVRSLQ